MNAINSISSSATTSGTAGSVQTQARPIISTPSVTANSNDVKQAAQQQETAIGKEEVKQLVEQANMQLAGASNQRVSFGYEERLNLLYVQIKDSATGEVVREIPPKELIEQRAALSEMIGMLLDRNA
jgi:flagellar protein FlaG